MDQFFVLLGFCLMLLVAVGLLYLQIVGVYHSFKAHVGYGIVSIFLGPFALAIGAIKVFTGENILLRSKK